MRMLSLYIKQFGTVCEELKVRGFINNYEWVRLKTYEDEIVPDCVGYVYRVIIQPVVALMRLFPVMSPIVNKIARKVWINRAIRIGKDLLECRRIR